MLDKKLKGKRCQFRSFQKSKFKKNLADYWRSYLALSCTRNVWSNGCVLAISDKQVISIRVLNIYLYVSKML